MFTLKNILKNKFNCTSNRCFRALELRQQKIVAVRASETAQTKQSCCSKEKTPLSVQAGRHRVLSMSPHG